jgi:hypothetical protein
MDYDDQLDDCAGWVSIVAAALLITGYAKWKRDRVGMGLQLALAVFGVGRWAWLISFAKWSARSVLVPIGNGISILYLVALIGVVSRFVYRSGRPWLMIGCWLWVGPSVLIPLAQILWAWFSFRLTSMPRTHMTLYLWVSLVFDERAVIYAVAGSFFTVLGLRVIREGSLRV